MNCLKDNKLKKYELFFLKFHLQTYGAKFIKVVIYKNKHLPTEVILFNGYKRKLKYQPTLGETTLCGMFNNLKNNTFYYVPDLINQMERSDLNGQN